MVVPSAVTIARVYDSPAEAKVEHESVNATVLVLPAVMVFAAPGVMAHGAEPPYVIVPDATAVFAVPELMK